MRSSPRAFTLLEVLVAISILGLSLTAILSAQTGLFASSSYAERISIASGLARCKISELEIKVNREGYSLTDIQDEGPCCGDETPKTFKCKWKIQKVVLPPPPTNTALTSGLSSGGGLGALGAIAAMGQSGGSLLGANPSMGQVAGLLTSGAPPGMLGSLTTPPGGGSMGTIGLGGGLGGSPSALDSANPLVTPAPSGTVPKSMTGAAAALAPLVMGFVYPTLKPMLEASIRKMTVGVHWKDGNKDKDLTVQEFVTNPQMGGLDPNAAKGLDTAADAIGNMLNPGGAAAPAAPGGVAR